MTQRSFSIPAPSFEHLFLLDVVCHTFSGRLIKFGPVEPSWKENDRFYGKGSWLSLHAVVLHGRPATGLPCG